MKNGDSMYFSPLFTQEVNGLIKAGRARAFPCAGSAQTGELHSPAEPGRVSDAVARDPRLILGAVKASKLCVCLSV